jgi:hypothetical protein
LANQSSTRFSRDEYLGVKCRWYAWVCVEKRLHFLRPVSGELVDDDVDLAPAWLGADDVRQELHERGDGLPDDLTRARVQRGVQRERTMPIVFKAVAFGASWRERQYRIQAIECLNGRFSSTASTTA